jgi:hypothetical protein
MTIHRRHHYTSSILSLLLLLFSTALLLLTVTVTAAQPPLRYLTRPTAIWNQAIQTIPSQNNAIVLSPDTSWLYVTSVDLGTLSKLNPANGKFVQYYDKVGVEAKEGGRFVYGQGRIEFFMDDGSDDQLLESASYDNGGTTGTNNDSATTNNAASGGVVGSYLLYWVLDVSQQGYYSKVVCVEHDDDPNSEQIVVRWVATLSGILNGMPKIG